jgi:O-6-methylguanine DNA methyltransferase
MILAITTLCTPLGDAWLAASTRGLVALGFGAPPGPCDPAADLAPYAARIDAYFARGRPLDDVPLDVAGTPFQRDVWRALLAIPLGARVSYAELAIRVGRPRAVRAVARANATNRVALVVPCHRVVGKDGDLRGYAWGTSRKAWLLAHEARRAA